MTYIPNTQEDRAYMLRQIGVKSFNDLIANLPENIRRKTPLSLPASLSEWEVVQDLKKISAGNLHADDQICFLGGGAYDHYIPAAVDAILSRSEFYTAYTPYQAEISQGTLQAIYEFQTCICELTGMEVANASLYDGATTLAEAILMANSINKKTKVCIPSSLNPDYFSVIQTYTRGVSLEIEKIHMNNDYTINFEDLRRKIDENTSAVVIQQPNFFGFLEDVQRVNDFVRSFPGCKYIVCFNPISLGLIEAPGNYGADIAVGEGQPLGIPLSFGGPYLGLFATRNENIRKVPGRLSGRTVDSKGSEGFTLTLQTREQHIKRERATSNICTNQGLMALAASVYMSLMGKEGIQEIASLCYNKAHYLAEKLNTIRGFQVNTGTPFFNEFVVETDCNIEKVLHALSEDNILGGPDLSPFGIKGFLVSVTEKRSRQEMDKYAAVLAKI